MTEAYAATSFIVPEIISIPEEKLNSYIEENKDLQLYRQFFREILRQKEHVLSEKEEELLALASEMAGSPREIFTMFNNADIKFPSIKDEDGEEVELTKVDTLNSLKVKTEESAKMHSKHFTALTANSKTPLRLHLSEISRLPNSMPLPPSTTHPLRLLWMPIT
ncbi:oligoendopeptidase F [Acetivibrio straminisolvens JCM 21531]|uniref:Oligoendopeptidase F n=1 Tax=Acetivibrio straminisolvens JCM 21531 TaxID=1294263 RepID=W4VBZ0_9FIRM|nr:oligoendopeptidase F [Acetivibrio straminisolvens JCM 21531]